MNGSNSYDNESANSNVTSTNSKSAVIGRKPGQSRSSVSIWGAVGNVISTQRKAPQIVPISKSELKPLSHAQERLWILQQLATNSTIYNILIAKRISGILDVQVFEKSINELVRRHDILQTSYRLLDGIPYQSINEDMSLSIEYSTLRTTEALLDAQEIEKLATREAQTPFDLENSLLIRIKLMMLDVDEHVLFITVHHSIFDGISANIFLKELMTIYDDVSNGNAISLPKLIIQYADFAVWQRKWLQNENLIRLISYWKRKLDGAPFAHSIPLDRPRPMTTTYRGAKSSFVISPQLTNQLREISYENEATLFMTLLAAFKILIYRYSGSHDIVIGSPFAGRNRNEIKDLIGLFANTLVLRTTLSSDLSFKEALHRVAETVSEAFVHQDLPFDILVKELQPERDLSYSPLFQVMFAFESTSKIVESPPSLVVSAVEWEPVTSKFDLTLTIREERTHMEASFNYSTEIFETSTINRLSEHFQKLLGNIVADPNLCIGTIPILTKKEYAQMVVEWNNTIADYPLKELCIHKLIEQQTELTPDRVAVIFEDQKLTYRQLNNQANYLAAKLSNQGIGRGSFVPVLMDRGIEVVVSFLSIMKCGAAYVPIDISWPSNRQSKILEDLDCCIILVNADTPNLDRIGGLHRFVVNLEKAETSLPNLNLHLEGDSPIYAILTSGSTGRPKAAIGLNQGITNRFLWMNDYFGSECSSAVLQTTHHVFDSAVWQMFWPLINGGKTIIPNSNWHTSADIILSIISKYNISIIDFVPSIFDMIVADLLATPDIQHQMNSLRVIIMGGEEINSPTILHFMRHFPDLRIINLYGPTEASIGSIYHEVTDNDSPKIPIGRPISNTHALILDQFMNPVPVGVTGELYLSGLCLGQGYLNDEERTADVFLDNPFSNIKCSKIYKTGDLARFANDGNIEFIGRVDNQVKIRGNRIELGEIEFAISKFPDVQQTVVHVIQDPNGVKQLVAYIVFGKNVRDKTKELTSFLNNILPSFMIPAIFIIVDTLAMLPNGKIDKNALPTPIWTQLLEEGYVPPRTYVEKILTKIWTDVFDIRGIGINDNFFQMGGHSLLGARLISRISKALHVQIPLRVLFNSPTIAEMTEEIAQLRVFGASSRLPPIHRMSLHKNILLSFSQQRLWFLEQLEENIPIHHIQIAWRLFGPCDQRALENSLQEIIRRHSILRTVFSETHGLPSQEIQQIIQFSLLVTNQMPQSDCEWEISLNQIVKEQATRKFDLSSGPLLRAHLIKRSDQEHALILTFHHIIFDGWSTGLLVRELSVIYEAIVSRKPSPLPELTLQYSDFANWQRKEIADEILESELSYWTEQLNGSLNILELPSDRPRPSIFTYIGGSQSLMVSKSLVSSLKALAHHEGATLFMVLLAAFKILLLRYSGQEDISVGTPVANRSHVEIEKLIGYFANTIIIRTQMSGNPTIRELISQVREITLAAYEHQHIPIEKLVEVLKPPRDLGRNPLFQVLFAYNNIPVGELTLPEISASTIQLKREFVGFDLALEILERHDGLKVQLSFYRDLFNENRISQMLRHYNTLLHYFVTQPDARILSVPIIDDSERQQLLDASYSEKSDFPSSSIPEVFEAKTMVNGDAIALVHKGRKLSYGLLNLQANQLARFLRGIGVSNGVVVGVCVERSLEMIISILGILKSGAAYLPLDPAYPTNRLDFMIKDSSATVIITKHHLKNRIIDSDISIVCLDCENEIISQQPNGNLSQQATPDSIAYLIYTSGSTGHPKGVQIAHKSVVNLINATNKFFKFDETDVWTLFHSFAFDFSVWEIWGALLNSSRLVVLDSLTAQSPIKYYNLLCEQQVTVLCQTPSAMRRLLQVRDSLKQEPELAAPRVIICGGEALPGSVAADATPVDSKRMESIRTHRSYSMDNSISC